jgi:hypothetical protein
MANFEKVWDEIIQDQKKLEDFARKSKPFFDIENALADLLEFVNQGKISSSDYTDMCNSWKKLKKNVNPFA